jgi:TolB-like protein
VLPLENFTESGAQDYFSAGMHEELIAQLSQLAGLRVVSRTSVLRYVGTTEPIPRIGRDLQVDAVIEGSVRRGADTVRITVQLIHAASDTHVWTKQYNRSLEDDVLALQSEVALDIARQIQAELSPEETNVLERTASRDVDPKAQDAYLRGKYEYDKGTSEGYRAALQHFQEAVEQDSAFAPALASLAGTRFLLGMAGSGPTDTAMELARHEAEHAVDMDSTSAEAREVLTIIRQAMPAIRTGVTSTVAVAPGPPDAATPGVPDVPTLDTAWVAAMTQMGRRIEEQVRRKTYDSERASRIQQFMAARQLVAGGLFGEATRVLSDLVDAAPEMDAAWELMARAEISAGDPQGAVGAIEGWSARGGSDAPDQESVRALQSAFTANGARGYWTWMRARLDERRTAGKPVSLTEYAAAQAGSGDGEGALTTLERALERHDRGLVSLQSDPVWDALRSDPRFTEIARRSRTIHYDHGVRGRAPSGR